MTGEMLNTLVLLTLNVDKHERQLIDRNLRLRVSSDTMDVLYNIDRVNRGVEELLSHLTSILCQIELLAIDPSKHTPDMSLFTSVNDLEVVGLPPRLSNLKLKRLALSGGAGKDLALSLEDSDLIEFECPNNDIEHIEAAIATQKHAQYLNFSHNKLSRFGPFLRECVCLTELDCSFNRFSDITELREGILGNLHAIHLNNNAIVSTAGLEKVPSLKLLDLSENLIESWNEIERVAVLPVLESLYIRGNPVSSSVPHSFPGFSLDVSPTPTPSTTMRRRRRVRTATIADVDNVDIGLLEGVKQRDTVEYEDCLDRLRDESGPAWLVVLNEMAIPTPPPPPPIPHPVSPPPPSPPPPSPPPPPPPSPPSPPPPTLPSPHSHSPPSSPSIDIILNSVPIIVSCDGQQSIIATYNDGIHEIDVRNGNSTLKISKQDVLSVNRVECEVTITMDTGVCRYMCEDELSATQLADAMFKDRGRVEMRDDDVARHNAELFIRLELQQQQISTSLSCDIIKNNTAVPCVLILTSATILIVKLPNDLQNMNEYSMIGNMSFVDIFGVTVGWNGHVLKITHQGGTDVAFADNVWDFARSLAQNGAILEAVDADPIDRRVLLSNSVLTDADEDVYMTCVDNHLLLIVPRAVYLFDHSFPGVHVPIRTVDMSAILSVSRLELDFVVHEEDATDLRFGTRNREHWDHIFAALNDRWKKLFRIPLDIQ